MTIVTIDDIRGSLVDRGSVTLAASSGTPLQEIADSVLGPGAGVRSKFTTLTPRAQQEASTFSLSAKHGLAAFDAHTDGAAELLPPRWCVMRLAAGAVTKTPTLLWDFRSLRLPEDRLGRLRRGMFVVRGGPQLFYTSILRAHGDSDIVRFNRVCMEPTGRGGATVADDLATTLLLATPLEHHWEADQVLVFDNWRVLHARPTVGKGDAETRRLERLLITEAQD